MGNRTSLRNDQILTPDPLKRSKNIHKHSHEIILSLPKDDKIDVVNDVVNQYNDGVMRGSTRTNFRDDRVHYCDKVKEVFGDKLEFCLPGNFKDTSHDEIFFMFK